MEEVNYVCSGKYSLVNQTPIYSAALAIVHHQHVERGSRDSGHNSVARWNAMSCDRFIYAACILRGIRNASARIK